MNDAAASTAPELPRGIFETALASSLALHEARVRALYNRHRAIFAENVVAALLPGAHVVDDPAAAWDVSWTRADGRRIRVEVKCSGDVLPRRPDKVSTPRWSLPATRGGWDPERRQALPVGMHCDVIVCARHTGTRIEAGWTFLVLEPQVHATSARLTVEQLVALGAIECHPSELASTIDGEP